MHKIIIACTFISLFAIHYLTAQTGIIRGTVFDSVLNERKSGILIQIQNNNKQTISNDLGNFYFSNLEAGTYTLKTFALGYQSKSIEISISEKEEKEIIISLQSAAIRLQELTITQSENHAENKSGIGLIDRKLLPVNSAQDLLQLVPGLFIAQHAGGGKAEQIFIRGFDCDHGIDFSVNVDGMPVNMVSHAHGQGYADMHFVIPETVDRLQTFKGTYYADYGNFATAGAGEFSTKNTLEKSMVKLEYGRFNTQRIMTMLNLLNKKHLFGKAKESAYIAGEYNFSRSYFESPQNFKRINLFAKYNAAFKERNFFTLSASLFTSDWDASGQIPDRAVQQNLISRFGSIDNTEGGSTGRNNVNAILKSITRKNAIIKNQFYYSFYRFNLYSNFTFFLNDSINGDQIQQTEKGRNILGYRFNYEKKTDIGKTKLQSRFETGIRMDKGGIALLHTVKRTVLDTTVNGLLNEQNIYAFADETWVLNTRFSVNAALRADYFLFGFQDKLTEVKTGTNGKVRVSPKLNAYYKAAKNVQLFAHAGYGFHSNDARSVVLKTAENSLPRAFGYEAGSTFKLGKKIVVNAAVWGLDLENELVYVGDEGIVEINGATRRIGTDLDVRAEIMPQLFADFDLNYNHGRFTELAEGENYIPLAPTLTSTGGITLKKNSGFNASVRYRYISNRPANENNSVTAKGYFLLDAIISYTKSGFQLGLSAENLLNVEWNQAQFDTESRLKNESAPVSELHYTPGTPFFLKASVGYSF